MLEHRQSQNTTSGGHLQEEGGKNMDEKTTLEFLTAIVNKLRERKPTTTYAIIGALTWLATCHLIGPAALILAVPAFLIALAKIM